MYDDLNLQDEDVDYMQDYGQADELSNMDTSSVTDGGGEYHGRGVGGIELIIS